MATAYDTALNQSGFALILPPWWEGHPLRKSFPLLAREVKPWPGTVDVEGMPEQGPSTENVEAAAKQSDEFVCQSCFLVKRSSQLANRRKMICRDCAE